MSQQARWRFTGAAWNIVGNLEVLLRDGTLVRARIENCNDICGYWEVRENGVLVGFGRIDATRVEWRSGAGPRLEAERVINFGATESDRNAADAETLRAMRRGQYIAQYATQQNLPYGAYGRRPITGAN